MRITFAAFTFFVLFTISLPAAWAENCQYGNSDYLATHWHQVDPNILESLAFLVNPGDEDCGNGCYTPGVIIETSGPSHVTGWPEIGGINVGADCEFGCLPSDRAYFLSIEFLAVNAEISFPRSPDTTVCTSFIDRGDGFLDLQDIDGGGGLVIYCQTTDCDDPLPINQSTWGSLKALYR